MPWEKPQAALLPDGRRLHLNQGPIDLIIQVFDDGRERFYRRAVARFETILEVLAGELPELRKPLADAPRPEGPVARRMLAAIAPYGTYFVTPMAAVAGAVADEMLEAMLDGETVSKAYVNNGGDIAFHLHNDTQFDVDIATRPAGRMTVTAQDAARGVATSGWRGRSFSLGIADSVTVLADSAAAADVAATLIANAVDLSGHPAIGRTAAHDLAPDSDLGDRLVTTSVGALRPEETNAALNRGTVFAQTLRDSGAIVAAVLMLNDTVRWVTAPESRLSHRQQGVPHHA